MKSLMDPNFKYIPADKTDIRVTFERIRQEQKEALPAVFTSNRQKEQDNAQPIPFRRSNS